MVYPEEFAVHLIGVGGLVIHEQRILLVKPNYGPAKGHFLIPGGYLEQGETLNEAVVREIREETGMEITPQGVLGIRTMRRKEQDRTDLYCLMRCVLISDPDMLERQESEIEEVSWIPLTELDTNQEVHAFTRYLVNSVRDKVEMVLDKAHNNFMKERLKLSNYEQYWVV